MFGYSTYDAGSEIDCGIFSPSSAAIAALIVTATWAGPVPADEQCNPLSAWCAHGSRRAALHVDADELLVNGNGVGGGLLRSAVIPLAEDLHHLELLSRLL